MNYASTPSLLRRALLPCLLVSSFLPVLGCSLDDGPTAIPNPSVTLKREYWQIFQNESTSDSIVTYYMLPRPDGADAIVEECKSKGPNATRFSSLYLCEEPGAVDLAKAQAELKIINNLSLEDALLISTFLHKTLRFEATQWSIDDAPYYNVWPAVFERDWLEICKTGAPLFSQGNVKLECERASATQKIDIAYSYTKDQAEGIAKAMNDLYGITTP